MGYTVGQFFSFIRRNITDELERQNTAERVRAVMEKFATDYFNKASDKLPIASVDGLQTALETAGDKTDLNNHIADTDNPHNVTAAQLADLGVMVFSLIGKTGEFLLFDTNTGKFSTAYTPADLAGANFSGDVFLNGPGETGPNSNNASRAVSRGEMVNFQSGFTWKKLARLATQVNVGLTGTPIVDGVQSAAGNRILVKAQTNPAQNGVYLIPSGGGAWVRADDANAWSELVNATIFISEGTNDGDKLYTCTVDDGGTIGTTAVGWTQVGAAINYQFGSGFDVTGNTVTVNVQAMKALLVYTTDNVQESGTPTNKYFTEARARATVLFGLAPADGIPTATSSLIQAWGNVVFWLNNFAAKVSAVVVDSYVLGTNTVLTQGQTLRQMLGNLQAQINNVIASVSTNQLTVFNFKSGDTVKRVPFFKKVVIESYKSGVGGSAYVFGLVQNDGSSNGVVKLSNQATVAAINVGIAALSSTEEANGYEIVITYNGTGASATGQLKTYPLN
jgi:hypothetical protein